MEKYSEKISLKFFPESRHFCTLALLFPHLTVKSFKPFFLHNIFWIVSVGKVFRTCWTNHFTSIRTQGTTPTRATCRQKSSRCSSNGQNLQTEIPAVCHICISIWLIKVYFALTAPHNIMRDWRVPVCPLSSLGLLQKGRWDDLPQPRSAFPKQTNTSDLHIYWITVMFKLNPLFQ